MTTPITQVLGFDAAQALAELAKLDTSMAQLESRLNASVAQFSSFNKAAGKTVSAYINLAKQGNAAAAAIAAVNAAQGAAPPNAAANAQAAATAAAQLSAALNAAGAAGQSASVKIGNALVRIGKQSQQSSNQVVSNVNRMTTSLQLLSRIVFTQAIVRALSQLRNALRATASDAVAFQTQLALITTIDQSGASIENLSDSIRGISDSLNVPLLEVAAGAYQAISNQVGEFGESLEFTAKAAEFAKSTGSTVAESVDLISGALKAYQLDLSETDRVASVFFKTVDLGRISAKELANSFGRVGPVSAELGLSLEELNGALAAITVRGSKTSEALTQVRAITTALLKPSQAMAATLESLGFASGESAIKTLGLAGVLSSLEGATKGSAAQMAALFPNVRGLSGVASLTGDDLKSLTSNIREMESVSKDFAKEKFLQATATDAARVTKEINELKNAFTVDLGQALLSTTVKLSDFVGGVDAIVAVVGVASPAILGIAGSIATLGAALTTAKLAGLGLNRALGLLALAPAAAGIGASIGEFIGDKASEARNKQLKELEESNRQELKVFNEALKKKRDSANEADAARLKATRQTFQEFNRIYLQDVANARVANGQLVDSATSSLGKILKAREGLVEALGNASQDTLEFAKDSQQRIGDALETQGDRNFDFKISGLSDAEKVVQLSSRAKQIAQEAANTLAQGSLLGDSDVIAEGVRLFEKAQTTGEAALSAAGESTDAQRKVYSDLKNITNLQIGAEQQLIAVQAQRRAAIDAEKKAQEAITEEMRKQVKVALENTGEFDANGNRFGEDEQAEREKRRREALKKVADSALSQGTLDSAGVLGIADFVSRFESELSKDPVQVAFDVNSGSEKIKADLNAAFENFTLKAKVDVESLSEAVGRDLITPEDVDKALEEVTKLAAQIREKIDTAMSSALRSKDLQAEIDKALETAKNATPKEGDSRLGGTTATEVAEGFRALNAEFEKLVQDGSLTKEALDSIIERRNELGKKIEANDGFLNNLQRGFSGTIEQFDVALTKAQQLLELQKTIPAEAPAALNEQLSRLENILANNLSGQFGGAQQAMANSVSPVNSIASAWERAAAAAERTARAAAAGGGSGGGSATNQAFGGLMHLAAGGGARGIDTIPAMLSPGEFVMNAKSSRKFYSQLQAMNAGQTPTYRNDGGSVTTVGDINVSVHGGSTSEATVRDIGKGLKRELRRRTLEL